jgi:hypothetical protein
MISRLRPSLACVVFLLTLACSAAVAQQATSNTRMPDLIPVPAAAQPSPDFNADAATDAYLAEMPATARARSDAYFEGGYWLILRRRDRPDSAEPSLVGGNAQPG